MKYDANGLHNAACDALCQRNAIRLEWNCIMTDANVDIRIVAARPEDAAAIARVLLAAFAEYEPLYTAEGFRATVLSENEVTTRMKEGPVWVAMLDQDLVATVSVIVRDDSFYVRGMAVEPSARGHRIGELLLRHVESYAASERVRRLFLSTTPFLHRAIKLYEKFGFHRTGEGPQDLHGTPLFTMEKAL